MDVSVNMDTENKENVENVVENTGDKTLNETPKCIDHYLPQIFWHDKTQIMSVHVQPTASSDQYISKEGQEADLCYKVCTSSVQHEVRVWELAFCKSKQPGFEQNHELGINFVANLIGHGSTLNLAQYSPDGQLIASGDVDGKLYVWKIFPRDEDFIHTEDKPLTDESAMFDMPPNKENWLRAFPPIGHDNDLNALAFSPNSQFICTAASDDLRLTNAKTGKAGWSNRNFRRLITGLAWDPLGRYIVSMSSDRRMDIVDAHKGHRLRTCHNNIIPTTMINNQKFEERAYKMFFDQHVYTLTRSPDFSSCGELLFAPAGQLETADANIYGTYVFRRCDFDSCLPYAFFPCIKPTLMVRVSPVKYELRKDTEENFVGLPYRLIFAVMCAESVFFYDTQSNTPIGFVYDMFYDNLTSISWTPDGKVLAVSSLEGFNMFLHIKTDELRPTQLTIERPLSPPLKKLREPRPEAMEFGVSDATVDGKSTVSRVKSTVSHVKLTPKPRKNKAVAEVVPSIPSTNNSQSKSANPEESIVKIELPKKRKITTFFEPITKEDDSEKN